MKFIRDHGTLKFLPPHMNSVLVETWNLSNYHPQQSPSNLSLRLISSPSPHRTFVETTKLVLQALNSQTEINWMISYV